MKYHCCWVYVRDLNAWTLHPEDEYFTMQLMAKNVHIGGIL